MNRASVSWRRAIIRAAWLEWLVGQLEKTGDGFGCLEQVVDIPGWFKAKELGLGRSEGPSIFWTLEHLEQINRKHLVILLGQKQPKLDKNAERRAVAAPRRQKGRKQSRRKSVAA
jgi:hypothetical protein